jgi:itaconate CoA-transferase
VIKVERPGSSDSARAYDSGLANHFVWTNHSKQSLAPDLKGKRYADPLCGKA